MKRLAFFLEARILRVHIDDVSAKERQSGDSLNGMLSVKLVLADVDFLKHLTIAKHDNWLSIEHNASSVRDCTATVFNHLRDIDGVWMFF